jgi:hypothetical protein
MEKKKVKTFAPGKYILRAKSTHPLRRYKFGGIVVGESFAEYTLNAEQAKLLAGPGPQAWLDIGTEAQLKASAKIKKLSIDSKKLDSMSI